MSFLCSDLTSLDGVYIHISGNDGTQVRGKLIIHIPRKLYSLCLNCIDMCSHFF